MRIPREKLHPVEILRTLQDHTEVSSEQTKNVLVVRVVLVAFFLVGKYSIL